MTIQNDINLSITVTAALIDDVIPAAEYNKTIVPSTVPKPPGNNGIIPNKIKRTQIKPNPPTNSKDNPPDLASCAFFDDSIYNPGPSSR